MHSTSFVFPNSTPHVENSPSYNAGLNIAAAKPHFNANTVGQWLALAALQDQAWKRQSGEGAIFG